jgi:hypothetical protein
MSQLFFLWAALLLYLSGSANSFIWKHTGFIVEPPPKHFYFQDEPNDWVLDPTFATAAKVQEPRCCG